MNLLGQSNSVGQVLVWSAVLIGLLLLGAAVSAWLKGRLRSGRDRPEGFTLADLKRLRDEGKMSVEEYEQAKAALLQTTRGSADFARGDSSGPR